MVELNNKLKLPNYTRFEHKFLNDFEIKGKLTFSSNIAVVNTKKDFVTSLDQSIKQITNHLNKNDLVNEFVIDKDYPNKVELSFSATHNFCAHNIVEIKANTNNTILINYDLNINQASNGLEINAQENSHTQLVINIQGTGKCANFIKANVAKDASLDIYYVNSFANDLNDVSVSLNGINARSNVKTIAMAKNAKKYFSVRIDHFAKHSFGRIVNHGIGLDNSKLVINGFGKIHKDCKHSDNYQKSKILAISDSCHVEANPILLIDEYDVVASHAASVSNVNEEQLYYLKSRGISSHQAKMLLIKGFLASLINEVDNNEIKEQIKQIIDKNIGYNNEI